MYDMHSLSHTSTTPPLHPQTQIFTQWCQANLLWCSTQCVHKRWPATYLGVYFYIQDNYIVSLCPDTQTHTDANRLTHTLLHLYIDHECTLTCHMQLHYSSKCVTQNDRDIIDACSQNGGHRMRRTNIIRHSITHTHTHTNTQQRRQQLLFSSWSII